MEELYVYTRHVIFSIDDVEKIAYVSCFNWGTVPTVCMVLNLSFVHNNIMFRPREQSLVGRDVTLYMQDRSLNLEFSTYSPE